MQELVSGVHRTSVEKIQSDIDDLKKVKVKLIERAMAYDFQGLFFLQSFTIGGMKSNPTTEEKDVSVIIIMHIWMETVQLCGY